MRRRTPLLALILAPFALWAVVLVWDLVLLPLYESMWHSDFAVRARLGSDDPEARSGALRDATSARPTDEALIRKLVEVARADPDRKVRADALRTLGGIGHRRPLPAEAVQALNAVILTEQDDGMLSAAIQAVGQAAAQNRVPTEMIGRVARIFDERHLEWVYPIAAEAIGEIGAAQALPGDVFAVLNAMFANTRRPGERENLARAFAHIAASQSLPAAILDAMTAALSSDREDRVRVQAIYALAHANAYYPQSKALLTAAAQDPRRDVQTAAQHGLRIMEAKQLYASRDPMSVALDRSLPVETRLKAMGPLKVNRKDPAWREQVLSLARDDDPRVIVEGLGLFFHIAGAPDDDFDRHSLIPRLTEASSHPDSRVRVAAFGTLSGLFVHDPRYRSRAHDFRPQLEAGAQDPDAAVRVVALVAMLRGDPGAAEREAILKRGLADADPHVRQVVASWLGSPQTQARDREGLLERARQDPSAEVRLAAAAALKEWSSRQRAWPIELWQLWRAGEYSKVGLMVLTAVTVAAPLLIGGIFFIYYMARLLTYLYERRWRALAVVPVMATWAGASYGMFLLYFGAAHTGYLGAGKVLPLAGVLWLAIALYAGAGWGLHYAVRR